MARMKYVQRRANRFEFRFPLPDDIAGQVFPTPWPAALSWCVNPRTDRFKTELVRSLKSNDSKVAERAALPLIEEAHRLVDLARKAVSNGPSSELGQGQIADLIRLHEVNLLRNDEAVRTRGAGVDLVRGVTMPDGQGMTDDDLALYRAAISAVDELTRKEAAMMRGGEMLQTSVDRAVEELGVVLHPDDPAWRQLELGFIQAQRRALDGIKARLSGEDVPTPELPKRRETFTLSAATRRWAEGGGKSTRVPRENSVAEAKRAVQRFVELHGDLELLSITKAHARQYRDALARVPKALPHSLAKLPLPELLKKDLSCYAPRNAQTINKNLNLVAGILAKAERDGFFEELPNWRPS